MDKSLRQSFRFEFTITGYVLGTHRFSIYRSRPSRIRTRLSRSMVRYRRRFQNHPGCFQITWIVESIFDRGSTTIIQRELSTNRSRSRCNVHSSPRRKSVMPSSLIPSRVKDSPSWSIRMTVLGLLSLIALSGASSLASVSSS